MSSRVAFADKLRNLILPRIGRSAGISSKEFAPLIEAVSSQTNFRPLNILGAGRQGFVCALGSESDAPSGFARVIKIIHAPLEDYSDAQLERLNEVERLRLEFDLDRDGILNRLGEMGRVDLGGRPIFYQVLERIEGRTLKQFRKDGDLAAWDFRKRIDFLSGILRYLMKLEAAGMMFVHIDTENLMIDSTGRARLIDLDAIELGELSPRKRRRYLRRVCRVILFLLKDAKPSSNGDIDKFTALMKRLHAYHDAPPRKPVDPAIDVKSVEAILVSLEAVGG